MTLNNEMILVIDYDVHEDYHEETNRFLHGLLPPQLPFFLPEYFVVVTNTDGNILLLNEYDDDDDDVDEVGEDCHAEYHHLHRLMMM